MMNKLLDKYPAMGFSSNIEPMGKTVRWPNFAKHFERLLLERGVSLYRLDEDTTLRASNMTHVRQGTKRPTDDIIKELARYEPLAITAEALEAWRTLDECSPAAIREAARLLDEGDG